MKILFVSSEVVPFAKTGGLADVAGSLPKALKNIGHDVRVFMPRYKKVEIGKYGLKTLFGDLEVQIGEEKVKFSILQGKMPDSEVKVYFLENEKYFGGRDELYTVKGKDYEDNLERFVLFSKAAVESLAQLLWQPDIIHLNDWQSALIAPYVKILHQSDPFFSKTAIVYSIHNMGYLGLFPAEKMPLTGLGWDQFTPEKLEFWGQMALTKAGFVFADVISTVSETYAKEIQTQEYGHGLDGLLSHRSGDVYGILNGLDYGLWNPAVDPNIPARYSAEELAAKSVNKKELQKRNGLPQKKTAPLIGMITRLADQKGLDIMTEALEKVMQLGCQLVILGTGDPKYHELLKQAKEKRPKQIGLNLGFDAILAQWIYAGSDMFLMPSRYEPCGLGQLISFKYGTVPIVRKTGGLADTVHDFDPVTEKGDGFVFKEHKAAAFYDAVKRAVEAYKQKIVWIKLAQKVMKFDYSWNASARKYEALYSKALARKS